MIRLETILTPGRSLVNVPGGSKKRALEKVATVIAEQVPELEMQDVFEKLVAREKLGSTGFGNGIAIPHCRLEGCSAPVSALLHLEAPIDYDAIDGAPVDLLFVLLDSVLIVRADSVTDTPADTPACRVDCDCTA